MLVNLIEFYCSSGFNVWLSVMLWFLFRNYMFCDGWINLSSGSVSLI